MALKLARIATGGRWYISTVGAFHGKSMGAISMGGKSTYRTPYIPMVQQGQHVEYGNAEDARKAIKNFRKPLILYDYMIEFLKFKAVFLKEPVNKYVMLLIYKAVKEVIL